MTREEFNKRVAFGTNMPTNEEYKVIEYVYNFHPSISETDGKDQIAMLYNVFGMAVIRDMHERAKMMEGLEARQRKAREELRNIDLMIRDLKEGKALKNWME